MSERKDTISIRHPEGVTDLKSVEVNGRVFDLNKATKITFVVSVDGYGFSIQYDTRFGDNSVDSETAEEMYNRAMGLCHENH